MKDENWVILIVAVLCLMFGFFVGYDTAHENGYMHGATQAKNYHEATGEFPNEAWLGVFEGTRFNHSEEILDTLNPYGGN